VREFAIGAGEYEVFGYRRNTGFRRYLRLAKSTLNNNWTGSYTKPSPRLYPHQWNWDSGFIAIGYSHYDQKRAQKELMSLFNAQWPNGMVPQIVFNPRALGNYFPEPDFWQIPGGGLTSGITMPPLHATACLHIYQHTRQSDEARSFLKTMYPKLLASHRYFYRNRDPKKTGLVYIRHPWESGLDNSPTWDSPLEKMRIDPKALPPYERKDLGHGIPSEPTGSPLNSVPVMTTTIDTFTLSIFLGGIDTTKRRSTGNPHSLFRMCCSTRFCQELTVICRK
jgi:hypothetical protein